MGRAAHQAQPPVRVTYHYRVRGAACIVGGAVANGGGNPKAFVAVVTVRDRAGQVIAGPYGGLSQSRLGAYKYIAGAATGAGPERFSFRVTLPKEAAMMDVSFAPWKQTEMIQFAAAPVLTGDA